MKRDVLALAHLMIPLLLMSLQLPSAHTIRGGRTTYHNRGACDFDNTYDLECVERVSGVQKVVLGHIPTALIHGRMKWGRKLDYRV